MELSVMGFVFRVGLESYAVTYLVVLQQWRIQNRAGDVVHTQEEKSKEREPHKKITMSTAQIILNNYLKML